MTRAKAVAIAFLSALVLPVQPGVFLAGSADSGGNGEEYVPHAPIRILSDAEFCISAGNSGWVDTGVVNCDTADGSRAKPYTIAGWSIDMNQTTGLGGIGIRVWDVSKSFVISRNYVHNGSRFQWNSSTAISLRLISDDQSVPSYVTPAGQTVGVERNLVIGFHRGFRVDAGVGGIVSGRWGHTYRTFSNNTFLDNEIGVSVFIPTTIEQTEVRNSTIAAIWQSGFMANYVLRGNDIRDAPIGFSLAPCTDTGTRPIVEYNNFVNTTDWAILQRGCTDVVVAPNNYWGHPSGPQYRRLQDGTVDPILDSLGVPDYFVGQGGRVTYGVLFAPWLSEPNPDSGPVPEP